MSALVNAEAAMQSFMVVVTTQSGAVYTFLPHAGCGVLFSRFGGPDGEVARLGELKAMPKIEVGRHMWGYGWNGSMAFVTTIVEAVKVVEAVKS